LGRIKAIGNPIPGGIAEAAGPARHVNENRSVDATTLTGKAQTTTAKNIVRGNLSSYGFRPGRSTHQALRTLQNVLWSKRLYWVLDIDIRKYFDSIQHSDFRTFLDRRVTDGVIRRMIDKWLKAGAVEDGLLRRTTEGSPQGGVISPCLSNVFLHHVLDEWFANEVRPRLRGDCTLVRFADDAVMACDNIVDAQRVLAVLGKRLDRFGLTLHPDKTRIVDFRPLGKDAARHPTTDGTTFDFLGLTHVWGRSRNGKNMVRQVMAKSRFARAVAAVNDWCRENRHWSLRWNIARPRGAAFRTGGHDGGVPAAGCESCGEVWRG
jgi:RNA-directed DNA polymerase